jgi:hypothetical protein
MEGQERCTKHHAKQVKREEAAGPIREGGCSVILTNGKRCQTFSSERGMCTRHANAAERARLAAERKIAEDALIEQRSEHFRLNNIDWRLCIQLMLTEWRNHTVESRVFWNVCQRVTLGQGSTINDLEDYYNEIRFMQILPYEQGDVPVNPPPGAPKGDLQRLAEDSQNVHTKEVSEQTEKLTKLLLAQTICSEQRTLQILTMKFSRFCRIDKMSQLLTVLTDMNLWYEKPTCITEGDALYRHLLDATVSKIEASPLKKELYKRAYQETTESVGLCCQGHLSRLINIFSGFDSEFSTPVSNNELLQIKMAHIAGTESPAENKVREAEDALRELNIPKEQWANWIDAL